MEQPSVVVPAASSGGGGKDARLGLGVGGRRFGSRGKYLVLHMQVDVFSFGIVLWKILTDHVSFNTTMNYVEENCAPAVYTPELRYMCIAGRYIQGAPLLGNSTAASDEILAVDTPSEGGDAVIVSSSDNSTSTASAVSWRARYIQGAPLLGNSTAASDEILAVDTPSEGGDVVIVSSSDNSTSTASAVSWRARFVGQGYK
ncbi:alpha/beta-Hydrolases superfamily protein [Zea mays]|uniref:Alpha/beta-Hydrolases superfamily protein n=1 Tax=Zea mays TaxID=4577 RepID=A0A1D6H2C2_MAIZE|nr:alpha/beta-Hydrolases superfamily protein [Zea mays]